MTVLVTGMTVLVTGMTDVVRGMTSEVPVFTGTTRRKMTNEYYIGDGW
jgi:hypothetical protein